MNQIFLATGKASPNRAESCGYLGLLVISLNPEIRLQISSLEKVHPIASCNQKKPSVGCSLFWEALFPYKHSMVNK